MPAKGLGCKFHEMRKEPPRECRGLSSVESAREKSVACTNATSSAGVADWTAAKLQWRHVGGGVGGDAAA
jgi:hypothetical protein